jgi:hypothetical protein
LRFDLEHQRAKKIKKKKKERKKERKKKGYYGLNWNISFYDQNLDFSNSGRHRLLWSGLGHRQFWPEFGHRQL